METVGRFAPSPSGRLHLGNLLCALLVWLSARQKDGRVLLRVEDLDTARRIFCVADERGELLTAGHTVHCDVYTRCTKAQAIQMALRCMNPQVIVCDELGTQADLQAVEAGLACGVVFVASVHCDTLEALNRKPPTARLLAMGAFETLVLLDGRVNPGHAVKVRTLA